MTLDQEREHMERARAEADASMRMLGTVMLLGAIVLVLLLAWLL